MTEPETIRFRGNIRGGYAMIDKLNWSPIFHPNGNLALGDVLLVQKIALKLFEDDALAIASKLSAGAAD